MRIFIEVIDIVVWGAIENGAYIPMTKDGDGKREKHWSEWSDDEKKIAQYDYRAKNIITSALSIYEFFRISQCKSAKEMWDTLQVTHCRNRKIYDLATNGLDILLKISSIKECPDARLILNQWF
uniref:Retrovirus-related Pol polyprotein from transposon TNT 1-94 n=1 Tax=Cajanus cajan TaxID=3821 RepID=A0A151QQ58_CAJCA|nr:hypothetical protein KK1_046958 [Cajanus cajan]